jgi:hypothetical protein
VAGSHANLLEQKTVYKSLIYQPLIISIIFMETIDLQDAMIGRLADAVLNYEQRHVWDAGVY